MSVEYKLLDHYIREYSDYQVCLNDGMKEIKYIEIFSEKLNRFIGKFYNYSDINKCIKKMNELIDKGYIK